MFHSSAHAGKVTGMSREKNTACQVKVRKERVVLGNLGGSGEEGMSLRAEMAGSNLCTLQRTQTKGEGQGNGSAWAGEGKGRIAGLILGIDKESVGSLSGNGGGISTLSVLKIIRGVQRELTGTGRFVFIMGQTTRQ